MKIILITLSVFILSTNVFAQRNRQPELGIVENLQNDSIIAAAGYKYLVEAVVKVFNPKSVNEEQLATNLKTIKSLKTSLFAMNVFMPGDLKLVGPAVDENAILVYAEEVFKRCQMAGIKMVVWGSGGARRVPDGFDQAKAKEQFISTARKVAELARRYKITMALENLNSTETNFITTAKDALDVVKKVNHPNFMLCVDIYHMLMEGEPAAIIEETKGYLIHCDIAEKENRAAPGVKGDDFGEYLKALKKVNYRGKIILECRWTNLSAQALPARLYLQKQMNEVWSK